MVLAIQAFLKAVKSMSTTDSGISGDWAKNCWPDMIKAASLCCMLLITEISIALMDNFTFVRFFFLFSIIGINHH